MPLASVRTAGGSQNSRLGDGALQAHGILSDDRLCRMGARVATIEGRPISHHDARTAATALAHAVPLVTHNDRDFAGIPGLQLMTENKEGPAQ